MDLEQELMDEIDHTEKILSELFDSEKERFPNLSIGELRFKFLLKQFAGLVVAVDALAEIAHAGLEEEYDE